eukprot:CAMPEP_0117442488 /NCGR_PEP_ID=MMETSP0759-20121206/4177_1 /TAXON_ID=63605 /ORGANISM="Percolomonas cosmopolitus, Strain WS" /LENGTH=225 /DNA_ID=CAMNT_0005234377 /DNA_START=151 /DNA_END=828 /DNA_ORIENTATION=+
MAGNIDASPQHPPKKASRDKRLHKQVPFSGGDDAIVPSYPSIPPYKTYSEFIKDFSVAQLMQILKDRGTQCSGCRKKKELARYIADQAQYLPVLMERPKAMLSELEKAKEIAEKWKKENEDRAEYDMVMNLFKEKEDAKKNIISKEVLRKLQNQGVDTKHIKNINPWDTFPGNQPTEDKVQIPEEERLQQMTEGELEDLEEDRREQELKKEEELEAKAHSSREEL